MRIWKLDGVEKTNMPDGILIARDGKSTPSAPAMYGHRVEYIDTTDATPKWTVVCDHVRHYDEELAEVIHKKTCTLGHGDCCSWNYSSWSAPCETRKAVLAKAKKILTLIVSQSIGPTSKDFELAMAIANSL